MRIAYCTNVRLPSERAHGHQIAQVCDALVHLGHTVKIFAPTRRSVIKEDYHTYYGAEEKVKISYLRSFDQNAFVIPLGLVGLLVSNFSLRRAYRSVLRSNDSFDLLYTRTPALLPPLLQSGIPVILELHQLPRRNKKTFVRHCNSCALVACLTSAMRDELLQWGVDESKLVVEGDAVDLDLFTSEENAHFRVDYSISSDAVVIGYAGQFSSMGLFKGVDVLLHAFSTLRKNGINLHILLAGGPASDQQKLIDLVSEDQRPYVHFTGQLKHKDIPQFLSSCDVLVYPAPASKHSYFQRDTSPLKLFEYMAAEKPIVCADLPPVRDIVNEAHVKFFEPGDCISLADAIQIVLLNKEEAQRKVRHARKLIERFTWKERMKRILKML